MRPSLRTKQGKRLLAVTVVEGEVAAEVAEDVAVVAEEVVVAADADGASRSKDGPTYTKDSDAIVPDKSRGTIGTSACGTWHHQSMRKWLARDPERTRDKITIGLAVIAQMV